MVINTSRYVGAGIVAAAVASMVALAGVAAGIFVLLASAPQPWPRHHGPPVRAIGPIAVAALGGGPARAHGRPARGEPASPAGSAGQRWIPEPGTPWQWQLTTPVDLTVQAPIYDIDGFENSAAVVRALHSLGRKVIFYLDVGAAENFRPDYASFPAHVLGKSNGWPGERSLERRHTRILGPILAK